MKKRFFSLSLVLFLGLPALGANDIQTASTSRLQPDEDQVLLAYSNDFSSSDLINLGSSSLESWTSTPAFGSGGLGNSFVADYMNDGVYATGDKKNTYFDPSRLTPPAVVTYNLNTTIAPQGYNLNSISVFMGWGFQSRVQANHHYTIEVSLINSADYILLETVEFLPFPDGDFEGNYESKVTLVEDTSGILASGVDSIRFTFSDPGGGNPPAYVAGTVIREIDVVGFAVGSDPNAITVATPTERQIIQRNQANVANIPVGGSFISSPDYVEARAVVRGSAEDNGTSTDWVTIETAPTGGSFSGVLPNVLAGGWYDIEVRSVVNGTPSTAFTVERVGVGDIFICAGQSNSANQGTPAATPVSDRVSARESPSENQWAFAADPLPIAEGTMGSVWSRLGDLIVAEEDVPVGFVSLGRNNSRVIDWNLNTLNNLTFLQPAVRSFPANGFKAFLWHQGEADGSTSAATYRDTLIGIINASRGFQGAGWNFPWYLAEASYQPSNPLTAEEGVLAGQRLTAFALSNVYLGADTNDFHLEGRSSDGIHFNTAGLLEHARQWQEAIYGGAPVEIQNGKFELNTQTTLTGVAPLADNVFAETVATAINSKTVLDWQILRSSGVASADGAGGYFNPGSETYTLAANGRGMSNLDGRHVATLRGGSSGNYFLQTLRALAKSNKTYFLSVAFGVRDVGADVFGGARIELLNGGTVIGSLVITESLLDALAGGSASGKFTNTTLRVNTGTISGQPHELGIRIIKVNGGVSTYLDFDHVVLTEVSTASNFITWLDGYSLIADPNQDSDGDGLRNLVEYAMGTSPIEKGVLNVLGNQVGNAFRITRRIGASSGLAYSMESSPDLSEGSWTVVPGVVETVVGTNAGFETVDLTRAENWMPGVGSASYYRLGVRITD